MLRSITDIDGEMIVINIHQITTIQESNPDKKHGSWIVVDGLLYSSIGFLKREHFKCLNIVARFQ